MTSLSPYHLFVMFGVIVLVHEFGHLIFAMLLRVEVTKFTFGIGPQLFAAKFNLCNKPFTLAIKLIPFGGSLEVSDKSFEQTSLARKSLVIVGGALFNLVTAGLGLAIMLFFYVPSESPDFFTHSLLIVQSSLPLSWHFLMDTFFNASSLTNQDLINIRLFHHHLTTNFTLWYLALFSLYSILSGILNLLPLPGLDGGRLITSVLEEYTLTSKSVTEVVHQFGITLLTWLSIGYSLFWLSIRIP